MRRGGEGVAIVADCTAWVGTISAVELARAGFHVYAGLRDPEDRARLDRVASESAVSVDVLPLDAESDDSVAAAIDHVRRDAGRLDVLVSLGGDGIKGRVDDMTVDQFRGQFDRDVFASIRLVKAALPAMRAQGSGRVIFLSSTAVFAPGVGRAASVASKAALEAFGEALQEEEGPGGVFVSLIQAGTEAERALPAAIVRAATATRPRLRYTVAPIPKRPPPRHRTRTKGRAAPPAADPVEATSPATDELLAESGHGSNDDSPVQPEPRSRGDLTLDRTLFDLRQDGYRLLRDVEGPNAPIHHVLIGPTGVVVLDLKAWKGRFSAREGHLLHAGREVDHVVDQARQAALELRRRLHAAGLSLRVQAVVVSMRSPVAGRRLSFPQVTVVAAPDLGEFVRGLGYRLDDRQIGRATAAVSHPGAPQAVQPASPPASFVDDDPAPTGAQSFRGASQTARPPA